MVLQPHSEPELNVASTTRPTNLEPAVHAGAFFPHATGLIIGGGAFTSNVINNIYSWPQEQSSEVQKMEYTGAFFPHATGFTIGGGIFACNVTNVYNEQFSEFRRIPLGDIKLGKELKNILQSGTLCPQNREAGVRRMYSAKICPDPAPVTVAIYQGHSAKKKWRQHLEKYKTIRHPNIMQLYGLARNPSVHAIVFHDELIPYCQFLRRIQHSSILSTYFIGYCAAEFDEAISYLSFVFQKPLIDYDNLPVWIQPTTGEVCLDLVQGSEMVFKHPWWKIDVLRLENVSLKEPDAEAMVISSLGEDKYHELCSMPSIAEYRTFTVSTQLCIQPKPEIFRLDSEQQALFRMPAALDLEPVQWQDYGVRESEILSNSWTRYHSSQTSDLRSELLILSWGESSKFWMAQANHIFALFETIPHSHLKKYVILDMVSFILRCLPNPFNAQKEEGYLFVCPPEDFRSGENSFQWPRCPAYWSLDPCGADRLSPEDAKLFGFDIIHIETVVHGGSWDNGVYEGLRRFHQAKGFDPRSQDIARHLKYPLFELSSEEIVPLAYHQVDGMCNLDPGVCQVFNHQNYLYGD
ncbi:hypothetical protein MSAN_00581300 [Mycena sanguinolenta]|uniref:Protein kinase domain-containing protein n=1 Tax=Mycena sanguinolenta TaxID=230812 RepID=A0A8H6Z7F4_9AGAR|nr:hypothetical protein MSAN_00581300 [Mycena sanguinolenta]